MQNVLIADIGGTQARFSLTSKQGTFKHEQIFSCKDFSSFKDVISTYLSAFPNLKNQKIRAIFALPGYEDKDAFISVNSFFSFSKKKLLKQFSFSSLDLINDLEAQTSALNFLEKKYLYQIGKGKADPFATKAVISPGTGLGAACLLQNGKNTIPLATEAGHTAISFASKEENKILETLAKKQKFISAEDLISGPGLERLYFCLYSKKKSSKDITDLALKNSPKEKKAFDLMLSFLGQFASNYALSTGAKGGIYLTGGFFSSKTLIGFLKRSSFRKSFEEKGRMTAYVKQIPTFAVLHPYPGLLGLSYTAFNKKEKVKK